MDQGVPLLILFFFKGPRTTEIYTLSLHDALPILPSGNSYFHVGQGSPAKERMCCAPSGWSTRSEEHTSELQSRLHLVCRLLLEKKKKSQPHPSPLCITCIRTFNCVRSHYAHIQTI